LVLALGGGGTRGAAHVGVLRVLEKNGVKVDAIVGTSIGAIVGGFYCSGLSADEIEKILLKKSFLRSYLTVPIPVRIMAVPIFFIPHLLATIPMTASTAAIALETMLMPKCSSKAKP
jgi:predicted acylesterase/phospholipase RssA